MPDDKRIFPLFDAAPDRKLPFQLSAEDVREAMTLAKPDNGPYLRAVSHMREAYQQAEDYLGGPVEVVSDVREWVNSDWVVTFKFRRKSAP